MELRGEQRIAAPRAQVWAMLNDPDILRQCIPGCETLEGSAADGFSARVTTKIGPVKATFNGAVTLSNVNAPESYTISGEGKGGVAGFARGGADVRLAEDGAVTVLTYLVNAQVGGKLAQLGSRLIDSTAKKLADQFFACFAERAGGSAGIAGAAAGTAEAAAGTATSSMPGPEGARLDTNELALPGQHQPVGASPEPAEAAAASVIAPAPTTFSSSAAVDNLPPVSQAPLADFARPILPEPDMRPVEAEMTPLSHGAPAGVVPPATAEELDPGEGIEALAYEAEEEVEAKAALGFLGGPYVWGLLVILALIVIFYFAR